jgi:hypothetical protein
MIGAVSVDSSSLSGTARRIRSLCRDWTLREVNDWHDDEDDGAACRYCEFRCHADVDANVDSNTNTAHKCVKVLLLGIVVGAGVIMVALRLLLLILLLLLLVGHECESKESN